MSETIQFDRPAAPLRNQVLQHLRTAIIEGRLAPGERLTERALTDMLGVSRTVVRESLRQLESEGLIALIPNKGPVVRALSQAEAQDLYRIREVLEGLAARLFAENAGAAQRSALEAALAGVVKAYADNDAHAILATKNDFYDALHAGAGSETLSMMLSTVLARIWRWRAIGLSHPRRSESRSRQSTNNLLALVEALKAGDGDLAEERARHEAKLAAREVMRLLDGENDPALME